MNFFFSCFHLLKVEKNNLKGVWGLVYPKFLEEKDKKKGGL